MTLITRKEKNQKVRYATVGTGNFHEARMFNYSLQGMYLESDLTLVSGTCVNIWISDLPENSLPDIKSAVVRWSEEITGAVVLFNYGTGIKYSRTIKHRDFPRQFRILEGGIGSTKPTED